MRPRGSYGDVALALRDAASASPGTVAELAQRACVGYGAARYTASRLVRAGDLVVVDGGRPAVLSMPPGGDGLADALGMLERSFWETGPSAVEPA